MVQCTRCSSWVENGKTNCINCGGPIEYDKTIAIDMDDIPKIERKWMGCVECTRACDACGKQVGMLAYYSGLRGQAAKDTEKIINRRRWQKYFCRECAKNFEDAHGIKLPW